MLLPFNLPINITIPSKTFLVPIQNIVFYIIPGTDIFLYKILFTVIFIISLILIIVKSARYIKFCKAIELFSHEDANLNDLLRGMPLNHSPRIISVRYTEARISPFVYGILHPVLGSG